MKVGLVTGGRWHNYPYIFLKKKGFEILVFDDDRNCFLNKKFKIKIFKIGEMKKYPKLFFWSPCNDFGSRLSDFFNKKNNYKTRIFPKQKILKKIDKKKYSQSVFNKNSLIKKKYLLKLRNGSGSKEIKIWDGKKFDKKKFYIEQYFRGYELSVEVISFNGNHKIFAISLRIVKKIKSAIAIISFGNLGDLELYLKNKIKYHLNKFSIFNGVSHIELIINDNKEINIIDTNLRCPGAGLTEFFYYQLHKENLFEIDYKILSNNFDFKNLKKYRDKFGVILYDHVFYNNFNIDISKISKFLKYKSYTYEYNLNKKDIDLDSNRKGFAVKRFSDMTETLNFLKKILLKKNINLVNNFLNFYYKNFS